MFIDAFYSWDSKVVPPRTLKAVLNNRTFGVEGVALFHGVHLVKVRFLLICRGFVLRPSVDCGVKLEKVDVGDGSCPFFGCSSEHICNAGISKGWE